MRILTLALMLFFAATAQAATVCMDTFDSYPAGTISGTKACPSGAGSWGIDNVWNTASIADGAGPDGSKAAKITFNADQLNRWFNYNPPTGYQDFWVKFNFKFDCGAGACVGGAKFLKIFNGNGTAHQANTTYQTVYQTNILHQILYGCTGEVRDAASYVTYAGTADTCPHAAIGGAKSGDINAMDSAWHTFKVHQRYNDNGQDNGVYEVWYDNSLIVSVSGVNNRSDLAQTYPDTVQLGGWNQYYGGVPYYIYYDNFVFADADPDGTPTHRSLIGRCVGRIR